VYAATEPVYEIIGLVYKNKVGVHHTMNSEHMNNGLCPPTTALLRPTILRELK